MSIEKLKNAGGLAGGILIFLAMLVLPALLLLGIAEFSVWALDWIPSTIGIAAVVCMIIAPLALIPATRAYASVLFGAASIVFGVCLWFYALAFTYVEWGLLAVIIGVFILGFGVLFTATLAAIFSGTWVVLGNLALLFVLYLGARLLCTWLARSAEQRALRRAMRETPSEVTVSHRIERPQGYTTAEQSELESDR